MDSLQLISRSTTPVVSLADAKTHLRVDDTASDTYITALVERATQLIEAETNCDLRTTTWKWVGHFPHPRWHVGFFSPYHAHDFVDGYYRQYRHKMFLPRCPLQSITNIYFYDADNNLTLWDNSNYYVMTPTTCQGWLQPALYYPATYDAFRPDAVQITFVSGFATPPALAIHAICLAVGTWYENRESETEARLSTMGLGFDRLLDQLTVTGVVG
jgi:hypothetical protein